jgi:hypothetical protein
MSAEVRRRVEAWFTTEGVPHFIEGHSASTSVLTRAAPLLVAYLVVTISLTASFRFDLEHNLLAIGVGTAIALGGWALVNVARGRPWRSLPRRVGRLEVAAFLLLPAVAPLLFGLQVEDALLTVAAAAFFLGIVYLATSYGLLAAARWSAGRLAAQRGSLGRLLTRALPLLMVFIVFVFLQSDTWRFAYALGTGGLVVLLVLLVALSAGFLVGQLAPEVRRLVGGAQSWDETLAVARSTPAAELCDGLVGETPERPPMVWHEWVNVGVVVVFGQGLQIVLVTVAVAVALIVVGFLTVPLALQEEWAGGPLVVPFGFELLGGERAMTTELVSVALILAAFSGLYFTVTALSDPTYRVEFFRDADRELERVLAVRIVYRTAIAVDKRAMVGPT